ncbi:excinuclease ABC subunit UvrA [Candidatus Dojkabacteria bacterium]|uniref:UvrABC system protein A n=1 Tax=Candidatus Dojkabacteria bacterium TaxID=2099670 RepID=A0A955I058_9BACT|nr:excinuclease ABC subunit UvrA [Candidatus Dojkabacteria bacterium]
MTDSEARYIKIKGASVHNLKNINIAIPRNKLTCFVGVSGSGKSTIAFDIIAQEGQRQYLESISSYARRYLNRSNRPEVDNIDGLSSAVVIDQKRLGNNPRSTVGTVTEIYTYLRMLYSRAALPSYTSSCYSFNHPDGACPACKGLGKKVEFDCKKFINFEKSLAEGAILLSDYAIGGRQWSIINAIELFDMERPVKDFSEESLERLLYSEPIMINEETSGMVQRWSFEGIVRRMERLEHKGSPDIRRKFQKYMVEIPCDECNGGRLKKESLVAKIDGKSIGDAGNMAISEAVLFIKKINNPYAEPMKPRLIEQLQFLVDVGVGYLSLNRQTSTLSGGESQRVKLARQLGSELIETIYVFDEPTVGLGKGDVKNVIFNLRKLCEKGNTVLVVEHDEDVIRSSDYIVEMGPGGGKEGGRVVVSGSFNEIMKSDKSLTAKYFRGEKRVHVQKNKRVPTDFIKIENANKNNLKNIDLDLPKNVLLAITGPSGSGKSSLLEEIIEKCGKETVLIDQSGIGKSYRSNIATYSGIFDNVRKIFASESGMSQSLFAFNSKGGCSECKGVGFHKIEMNFLGDIKVKCSECEGKRYKEKVLRYTYKGKNIAEVLEQTVEELLGFFEDNEIEAQLQTLNELGLGYIELGQTLDTLSGGECQRLKMVNRLKSSGEIYILDEPSYGLHFADVEKLVRLLNRLVDVGNSVIVVEHNTDVLDCADWIIELGPGSGENGGEVVKSERVL